ncbi:MAG: 50S ribosomal protein L13, partial [Candidatus Pelagibacter sp. TMED197]
MTPFIKKKEIKKDWYIINARNIAVGRLAAFISSVLRGKNKPTFNPHIDNGDFVVVTNIDKIKFTGKKFTNKKYYKHTGHPGGIKSRTAEQLLEGKFPERVVTKAIERMLPGGVLSRQQMTNLRVYAGPHHPHEAQNPTILDIKSM